MSLRIRMSGCQGGGRHCGIQMGDVYIGVSSDDALAALHSASGIAKDLSAVLAAHPELAPIMGPIAPALAAINLASAAAKSGEIQQLAKDLPVAAGVVSKLLKGW
jgi:hypothetical protein